MLPKCFDFKVYRRENVNIAIRTKLYNAITQLYRAGVEQNLTKLKQEDVLFIPVKYNINYKEIKSLASLLLSRLYQI